MHTYTIVSSLWRHLAGVGRHGGRLKQRKTSLSTSSKGREGERQLHFLPAHYTHTYTHCHTRRCAAGGRGREKKKTEHYGSWTSAKNIAVAPLAFNDMTRTSPPCRQVKPVLPLPRWRHLLPPFACRLSRSFPSAWFSLSPLPYYFSSYRLQGSYHSVVHTHVRTSCLHSGALHLPTFNASPCLGRTIVTRSASPPGFHTTAPPDLAVARGLLPTPRAAAGYADAERWPDAPSRLPEPGFADAALRSSARHLYSPGPTAYTMRTLFRIRTPSHTRRCRQHRSGCCGSSFGQGLLRYGKRFCGSVLSLDSFA